MARKRLSAPFGLPGEEPLTAAPPEVATLPAGETAASLTRSRPLSAPPISRVAAEASATAALEALAGEVARARAGGRMVEAVPLEYVETGHLVRDRVTLDEAEMSALIESLRLHGQRTPVDLVALEPAGGAKGGAPRYGLISGWRRITALRRLQEETGEARFGQVLALLRRPEAAGDAYIAMVEENEIRAGLSYYERARIAARATEAGAFSDRTEALRSLYAMASRAKRSKIGSFLGLVDALDGVLRFPAAIPERLGLALAGRLAEPGFAARLLADLRARPAASAGEETLRLQAAQRPPRPEAAPTAQAEAGIRWQAGRGRVTLSGPGVDAAFLADLEIWLQQRPASGRA